MRSVVVVLIGASMLGGCAESKLARQERMATTVATGTVLPSKDCAQLKPVTGNFAGAYGATPEIAFQQAVTGARLAASHQGANFLLLEPLRSWKETKDGVTWTLAEAKGISYRCPSEGSAPSAEQTP